MTREPHGPASIGILGGGQLGRMLSVAASRLGIRTHVFAPDPDPIAGHVAHRVTTAEYDDEDALRRFAGDVGVVTYEFENIPSAALDVLQAHCEVLPRRNALAVSQDRLAEKDFLNEAGLKTARYAACGTEQELVDALDVIGVPSILKTRRFGYDGKGQVRITDPGEAGAAWAEVGEAACIVEQAVEFECEISVIVARSRTGEVVAFDPGENVHREGILRTTTVPAGLSGARAQDAVAIASTVVSELDYVGVAGVELFVTADGLLVNEIAPRVHNSGHWTQNGCVVDQFEQHVRAVAGWPLGDGRRHANVVMTNLIGDEVLDVESLRRDPGVALHVYGKADVRPGRKMGHFNRITGGAG
ncbi:MAG TPA: 5-(carboxyamino)imidazole ribonucleotide synthase [Actinomycetota bacterium]|nr:5-(carboxyamino)imidazole ribonucleotide synthase [Actinomycetota bacterium]